MQFDPLPVFKAIKQILREGIEQGVANAILVDMQPGNSWDGLADDPDAAAPWLKRLKVRFWQLLPLRPLL